jgi:hypothetical protein
VSSRRESPPGPVLASSQGRARFTKPFASSTMLQTAAVACRKSKFSSAAPTASPAWRHAAASLSPPDAA